MSEIKANDTSLIQSADDVFDLYRGAGDKAMAGLEIEYSYLNAGSSEPMSLDQNKLLKNAAKARYPEGGDWIHVEPTAEVLEIISIPGKPDEVKAILDDTNRKIKILDGKAQELGLRRSWFQELPDQKAEDLLKNDRIVDVERYQVFYRSYRRDMRDIVTYFAVCKSTQISVSYKDPDHMLANVRRLYFLAPFLFLLSDNSSGFNQGKKFSGHQGMMHRGRGLGSKGGVPHYLFTAGSGEEYIHAHINHVMSNPLFMYYDENSMLTRLPEGKWSSFYKLQQEGLNTASNYFLAQSLLWPDVEIAQIKDADGNVKGHRYEARMFGTGLHQHQSALLIVTELAFNDSFANDVDVLLASYGFDAGNLYTSKRQLEKAYDNARRHEGKFFDIVYGTGSMTDFAKDFADLIEKAFLGKNFDLELEPLLSICRTGCTDGKVNRLLFPTLEETMEFQNSYDPALLDNPNTCAHMIFEKDVRKKAKGACQRVQA